MMDKNTPQMPVHAKGKEHASNILQLSEHVIHDESLDDIEIRFGYSIGYFDFVLEKKLVTEIVIEPTIFPVPNGPNWLKGMINLRGNILPVFDLTQILTANLKSSPGHYVLVVDEGVNALALLIDALPKSLPNPIAAEGVGEINNISADYLTPGVVSEDKNWIELDIKALAKRMKEEEEGQLQTSTS